MVMANGCEDCARLRARVEGLEAEVRILRGKAFLTKLEKARGPVPDVEERAFLTKVDTNVRCDDCDEWYWEEAVARENTCPACREAL